MLQLKTVNSKDLVASASPFHNRATHRLFEVQALSILFSSVADCLKKDVVVVGGGVAVVVVVVATSSGVSAVSVVPFVLFLDGVSDSLCSQR